MKTLAQRGLAMLPLPMLWTEKQTESYLVTESRKLHSPEGDTFRHTSFKLHWDIYDSLILNSDLTGEEMVGAMLRWVEQDNISFDEAFCGYLAYLDSYRRKVWGFDHL